VILAMMRTVVFAVCMVAEMAAAPLAAAETWANASVVLKHPNAQILPEKGASASSIYQIGWPATVKKTDGTWALLTGTPGFQRKSKIGWVRIYDLVNGNDDPTTGTVSHYYTSKIEESPNPDTRATWYWLRGIYWDNNNDSQGAIKDYALAILDLSDPSDPIQPFFFHDTNCPLLCHLDRQPCVPDAIRPDEECSVVPSGMDRKALLSDCYRRLGTALAAIDPVCTFDCWKKCFEAAEFSLLVYATSPPPKAPRLYYEWGNAYVNALTPLLGPPAPSACTIPACLQPQNLPQAVDKARDLLKRATNDDPQFADAHAALGDLGSAYAGYLLPKAIAAAKEETIGKAKIESLQKTLAKEIKDKKPKATLDARRADIAKAQIDEAAQSSQVQLAYTVLNFAIDDYRDSIQCDSGSNRGYLGRSTALQQLAYLVAGDALASTQFVKANANVTTISTSSTKKTMKSTTKTTTGSPTSSTTKSSESTTLTVTATVSPTQSTTETVTKSNAKSTPDSPKSATESKTKLTESTTKPVTTPPLTCPCCVSATTPAPDGCPPNAPPPEANICQLARANTIKKCTPTDPIAVAFAQVSALLAAANDSAQSALAASSKGISDVPSITQLVNTYRDLAYLNDAKPSVAFQYAASAYNLAANSVSFATKFSDGDNLQSLAGSMKQLYQCYDRGDCGTSGSASGGHAAAHAIHARNFSPGSAGGFQQLNYSRMMFRTGRR
jgi:hypothetical protein